jgi:hypothetical protein
VDTAVALVQSYLHVNGYFTVVEYPVLEAGRGGAPRTVTDLDVLAFRFPRAHAGMVRERGHAALAGGSVAVPDPVLGCPHERADMIVGEVKEGAARFNPAIRDPLVLEIGLARFGCCEPRHAPELVRQLLTEGEVTSPAGHSIRMVAFGGVSETESRSRWITIAMSHLVHYLRSWLREHWDVVRHAQVRDTGLAMLALLEKWDTEAPTDSPHPAGKRRRR